jgi:NAD(P)-dependent dehydrogenase (short-subunit alcohol dehydrogenase family)
LITGATRGIGRGIALALAHDGFDIVNVSPSGAEAPFLAVSIACDVADDGAHDGIIDRITREFGRLDLFVSNAGIAPDVRRDVLETTPASFDKVVGANLRGAFFLAQKAARFMLACRGRVDEFQPRMVFITSVSAASASRNRVEYCVSKAGLSMVVRVLADRLAPEGIPVFEVRPGLIRTDMTALVAEQYEPRIAGGLVPQGRWGEPDDVAHAVRALARGDFDYATGSVIDVGGGLHIPRL